MPATIAATVVLSSTNILAYDPGVIAGEIVIFLVLVAVLRIVVFKPLVQVLEARDHAIDGARAEAEAKMKEANARTAEYEERLREVRARAAAERDSLRAEGRKAEIELLEKVKKETAQAVEDGKASVRREAETIRRTLDQSSPGLVSSIVTRVLGRDPGVS